MARSTATPAPTTAWKVGAAVVAAAAPKLMASASGVRRTARVGEPLARAQSRSPLAAASVHTLQLRPGAASKRMPVPSPASMTAMDHRESSLPTTLTSFP